MSAQKASPLDRADLPVLLTEAEAAEHLRIGCRTLRDLRNKGKIKFVRVTARNIAYRPEHLEEYVALCVQRQDEPADPMPKGKRRSAKGPAVAGVIVPFSQRNKQ